MAATHTCDNCEGIDPDTCLANTERAKQRVANPDDSAMQALSDAGAVCGNCGDQPGDRNCPDCEECYREYVTALRAAGWAPRSEALREAPNEEPCACGQPWHCDRKVHTADLMFTPR